MQKLYMGLGGLIVLLIGLYFLIDGLTKHELQEEISIRVAAAPKQEIESAPEMVLPENSTSIPPQEKIKDSKKNDPVQEAQKEEKDERAKRKELIREELRPRLKEIAETYKEKLKYPTYSRLLSEKQTDLLEPNTHFPATYDIPDSNISYDLQLSRFILYKPDPIPMKFRAFSTDGQPIPQIISISGSIIVNKETVDEFSLTLQSDRDVEKVYLATYSPSAEKSASWPEELIIAKVVLNVSGYGEQSAFTSFQYMTSVGTITGIETEKVEGADLVIPINLSVNKPGRYSVTANLFSQADNKPISHLTGVSELEGNEGTVPLKVHIATLKAKNDTGPYVLTTFILSNVSESKVAYGDAAKLSFVVGKHDFSEYKDEEYVDPVRQKKYNNFMKWIGEGIKK
ncbi:hypothetical protein WDW89_04080 [Deltaproteobacteria bacterium TL4]